MYPHEPLDYATPFENIDEGIWSNAISKMTTSDLEDTIDQMKDHPNCAISKELLWLLESEFHNRDHRIPVEGCKLCHELLGSFKSDDPKQEEIIIFQNPGDSHKCKNTPEDYKILYAGVTKKFIVFDYNKQEAVLEAEKCPYCDLKLVMKNGGTI